MAAKRNVLARFVRETGVGSMAELTNEVMNRWVAYEVGRGASARSVNTYNSVIVAMVRYYRGLGMEVPVNLSLVGKLKEVRTRRRFYTAEELRAVEAVADETERLMIRIMFETGMRIAELVRMKCADVDGRRISFVGKGRKAREVYMREDTRRMLEEYVKRWGITGYMWCVGDGMMSLNGEPPTVNTVRLRLRRAFERAGLYGFYPHALRHSFATDLQLKGAGIAEIKEMIGHQNIATTERYLHGFDGKLRELFDKYR